MAAKGYITVDTSGAIARWLGADLTAAQVATATAWLEAAERLIDATAGQAWKTGAVVGERHTPDGRYLWLRNVPVNSSVPLVVKGYSRASTVATTLILTDQYEVDDWARGRVYLPYAPGHDYLTVDYTPVATVPAVIQEATAALLADWLEQAAPGLPGGDIKSYSVGQELSVTRFDPGTVAEVPSQVQLLLAPYMTRVVFA